jgi:hypothetical protein
MRTRRNPFVFAAEIERRAQTIADTLAAGSETVGHAAEQLHDLAADVRLLRLLITPDLNPNSEGYYND